MSDALKPTLKVVRSESRLQMRQRQIKDVKGGIISNYISYLVHFSKKQKKSLSLIFSP